MRLVAAWTKVNDRGTPSGRIHATRKYGTAVCGVECAPPISPEIRFYDLGKIAGFDRIVDHPKSCRKCVKVLGAQNK